MRAAKNPFFVVNAIETLNRDTIGRNSGNLLFAEASHLLLSATGVEVATDKFLGGKNLAAEINDSYDGAVLPLANAFRPSFARQLRRITETIKDLKVPFAMLSAGAQAPTDSEAKSALNSIEKDVKAFCSAVLDKSSKITVRGEYTAEYVQSLGFQDVEVIGCPSMTRMGFEHQVPRPTWDKESAPRVAYGVQPEHDVMGKFIGTLRKSGADLTYVGQDFGTLEMLVWGRQKHPNSFSKNQPSHLEHPEISSGSTRFYLDASTWVSDMAQQHFYVGTRVHGALASVTAGTAALLVAHDARTVELAQYHGLPFVTPGELRKLDGPDAVVDILDYRPFERRLGQNVAKVVEHLNENGFATSLDAGESESRIRYLKRLATTRFPEPVTPLRSSRETELIGELRRQVIALAKRVRSVERS